MRFRDVSFLMLFLLAVPPVTAAFHPEASIDRTDSLRKIILSGADWARYSSISLEVPKTVADDGVSAFSGQTPLFQRRSAHRFPPGPDGETRWVSFSLVPETEQVRFEVTSRAPITFAQILLGQPATPNSRIVGAFSDVNNLRIAKNGTLIIRAEEDLLGTLEAVQRVRLPAGFLGADTEAFDTMVPFGEAPFNEGNNVDTVMIRLQDIPVGGTTPVRLLNFRNRAVNPIAVQSTNGGSIYFEVVATLSPHAESSGFITIRPNGTYQSSMLLAPVFTFQRLDSSGNADGDPIVVDTVLQEIPGFPFYLASTGGRWPDTPPEGRMVTPASSNFFYNNPFNRFIHSNGPPAKNTQGKSEQLLAECLKFNLEESNE